MLDEYQIFITNVATRKKSPLFDDLTSILLKEEEQRKNHNIRFQSSNLALMAKSKNPYKGKPWERNVGCKSNVKLQQGEASSRIETSVKKNYCCYYRGKFGHYARDCRKNKFHESKFRRHAYNFVDREATVSDNIKNINLFISDATLSVETNDFNAWFIDSGASIHMACHRDSFETYHEKTNGVEIYIGDDRCHEIKGYGDVCVTFTSGHMKQIKNVMYVPRIKKKIISISTITNQGLKVEFAKSGCLVKDIYDDYKFIAKGIKVGSLYKLDLTIKDHRALSSTTMSTK
jgi:hypothetical protein